MAISWALQDILREIQGTLSLLHDERKVTHILLEELIEVSKTR
jgi:hypothetical protein